MSTRQYFNPDEEDPLQITMTIEKSFQKLIEAAGAHFICVKDNAVLFSAAPGEDPITLYPSALRTTTDVVLAVKHYRERQKAEAWVLAGPTMEGHNV